MSRQKQNPEGAQHMNRPSESASPWIEPPANASAQEVERYLAALADRAGNVPPAPADPLDRFPPLD